MSQNLTPPGTYKAKVAELKFGESGKGTPQFEAIIDVQVSTNDVRRRSIMLFMSDKAAQYSEEHLRRLGFNGDFEQPAFAPEWYADDFPLEVYVKNETYTNDKGEQRDAERWNFSSNSRTRPASSTVAAQAAQRWRATNGSATPAAKPSTPPPATPPARKGPPPAAPTPVTPKYGKDQAWEEWAGNIPDDKIEVSFWNKCVNTVGGGRDESKFTEADWKKLGAMHVEHPPF
jgi:hypothetical protein